MKGEPVKRRRRKTKAAETVAAKKPQVWKTNDPPFFREGERITREESKHIAASAPSEASLERLRKGRDQALLKQGAARQLSHEALAAGDAAVVAYSDARDASAGATADGISGVLPSYESRVAQQVRAKRARTDALSKLIEKILQETRAETTDEVLAQLRLNIGRGIIETVTDEGIEWTDSDGSVETSPISGLKHRISRAKKRIASRTT